MAKFHCWTLDSRFSHSKSCCDCMDVVQDACLGGRDGSGAEGSQWWKSKRLSKQSPKEQRKKEQRKKEQRSSFCSSVNQTNQVIPADCMLYSPCQKYEENNCICSGIVSFPAKEELKIKTPRPLSSLCVYYWSLQETEYWLGRPLIDLITFL